MSFVSGSGACPECQVPLRRTNFRLQLFEDSLVDKEVDIRRRILRDFNKKEEDFDTLGEYNDYLEMVEDVIFNLSNNLDILETNKRIAEYKEKNKDFIARNRERVASICVCWHDCQTTIGVEAAFADITIPSDGVSIFDCVINGGDQLIDRHV